MDIFGAMNMMANPQGTMMQYAMQGMINQHPTEWQKANEMFSGKSHKEQVSILRKMYKDKGMDLDTVAKQWSINI